MAQPLSVKGYALNGLAQVSSSLYNRVRLVDIDIDGYPDLFITMELNQTTGGTTTQFS